MSLEKPQTLLKSAEFSGVVKDSKFVGYCYPVASKSDAEQQILRIEQQHKKATHVCWAYRVYEKNQLLYYANDAGEPHGSAGAPILKALTGRELVNTLCVVVRYFGGTKLGIGGLIRTYGAIAGKVLDIAGKDVFIVLQTVRIDCPLAKYFELAHYMHRFPETGKPLFTEDRVIFNLQIESEKVTKLQADLKMIPGLKITQ